MVCLLDGPSGQNTRLLTKYGKEHNAWNLRTVSHLSLQYLIAGLSCLERWAQELVSHRFAEITFVTPELILIRWKELAESRGQDGAGRSKAHVPACQEPRETMCSLA
ncbi:hypothetical protein N7G274_009557 [Stereocaulon virgatum]|uniref:Uncharacterized protein n=1 Tax=Stereocaulon virgatum TaxID=373712 RepID=A0ABR3ZVH8_9LECA